MQVAADAGEATDKAGLKGKLLIASSHAPSGHSTGERAADGPPPVAPQAQPQSILEQLRDLSRNLQVETLPPPLRLGIDLEERPAWGLDCYTHRCAA